MKRKIITILLTLVFLVSLPLVAVAEPAHKDIVRGISGDSAKGFITDLTQWKRIAGSPDEKAAAAYIKEKMQGYGYETEIQEFPIVFFEDIGCSLGVVEPAVAQELHPNIMTYSPSGSVTAELVYVGLGGPADYEGKDVTGKIALIQRGTYYFKDKVIWAAEKGAKGAVIFNNQPGNFFGTLQEPAPIPAVSLSQEEGQYLLSLMESATVKAALWVETIMEQRTSQNVVATKKASRGKGTGKTVIMGGHLDCVSAGYGANDNASGSAVTMEVARVLKDYSLASDVKFVFFGAEETGLDGSYYYVSNMSEDDMANTTGMINLDMVGVGDKLYAGDMAEGDGWLVNLSKLYGSELGQEVSSFDAGSNSDHAYFEEVGIPVSFINWDPDPYYHTAADSLDKIIPYNLEKVGQITAAQIYDLSKTPLPHSTKGIAGKVNKYISVFKGKVRDTK
ncbi:MAG: M28 family peptidase [Bacillota bacterium]